MNFGLVCAERWWLPVGMLVAAAVLRILYIKDPDFSRCKGQEIIKEYAFLCVVGGMFLPWEISREFLCIQVCYAGMFVYLIVTGVMDSQLQMVSDFLHGIGLLSVGVMAFCSQAKSEIWCSFLIFCLIQYFVFRHMYGPADVVIFMVCSMFFAAEGKNLDTYLLHMGLTFSILGVVQLFRGNISRGGNLKEPVALIPYVVISFFVII